MSSVWSPFQGVAFEEVLRVGVAGIESVLCTAVVSGEF